MTMKKTSSSSSQDTMPMKKTSSSISQKTMPMKKTSGRQKIEIKKIEDTERRQVTFSKRRGGLFNKASELCVVSGAQVVILLQSVGGRVYAFGHPNVDSLLDTYLGNNVSNSSPVSENPSCMYEEYNKKYLEIAKELEVEKNKTKNVEKESGEFWWEKSFEGLGSDELEYCIKAIEELKNKVTGKADELRNLVTSSSLDTIANANDVDGLLDNEVNLPNLDQFLPVNVGFVDDNLMMQPGDYDPSGFSNYSFGNGELVSDNHDYIQNHGGNDLQVQSDLGAFGVPGDLYFGPNQI